MFDENFLMAVATVGAIAIALYEQSGDYTEAIAVMLFYQIGELFQSYAVGKSRRNISELMDIRPDYANVEQDGKLEKVDPDEVEIGSVIVVQPGEKVPIDGVILEGSSTLNTSALTGESIPREAAAGDEIISGCINMTGLLKVKTTKEFGESTVSRILDLVENASSRKSRSEEFISRFARNTKDLLELVEELNQKDVQFISQKESIDTKTSTGKFMLTVFGAIAELERGYILERQREGIEIAKGQGKYKGRPAKKLDNFYEVYWLWYDKKITATEACRRLEISRSTFYRKVKELDEEKLEF